MTNGAGKILVQSDEFTTANSTFAILRSYAKALGGIGKPEAIRIEAARAEFEREWRAGQPHAFFKARYDFKQVASSSACRQRGNLYQVRFHRSYRALLAFSDDRQQCWWLDVFHKQTSRQDHHIAVACERALTLQEQNTP